MNRIFETRKIDKMYVSVFENAHFQAFIRKSFHTITVSILIFLIRITYRKIEIIVHNISMEKIELILLYIVSVPAMHFCSLRLSSKKKT